MRTPKKAAQSIAKQKRSRGQIFMESLGPGPECFLSKIAGALYAANRMKQDAVLQHLQAGRLAASIRWIGSGELVRLPSTLWEDVSARDFQIRPMRNGTFRTGHFTLSLKLVIKHIAVPRLNAVALDATKSSTADDRKTIKELQEAIGFLDLNRRSPEVFVTLTDARSFADTYLGAVRQQERRGRKKTTDGETLLIEMFRQLHLRLYDDLPNQKKFRYEMTGWWNAQAREPRGEDWVEHYMKFVWAAIRGALPLPTP
jgi:hypothetical protein